MSAPLSNQALADVLDELIDVRPFPATASRVMTACDNESVTAAELSQIIEQDPVLTMKLLQIANSPMYGFSGEVRSVQHASVLIGLRALKNMAVSLAMGDVFGSGGTLTADARDHLWKHALACGSIAKTLSATTRLASPDEAFLGGIVHDVGKLIFVDHRPQEYAQLLSCSCSCSQKTVDAEIEAFGISHTAVGRSCGESWGLPEELSDVITFHHDPSQSDFGGELVDCVWVANRLSRVWLTDQLPAGTPDAATILQEADIDLSPDEIESMRQQALVEVQAALEVH